MTAVRLLTLAAALLVVSASSFSQKTKEVDRSVKLDKDGSLSIDTYKGSITIKTWDQPQVDIHARIEPDGWGEDQEECVQETEIRIDSSASSVRIESNYDRLHHRHSHSFFGLWDENNITLPFVRYTITMPRTAHLDIKDYKSDSKITDLRAPLKMETYKGTVVVDNLEGSIRLETYKGEVTLAIAKLTSDSRLETEKGTFDISLSPSIGCNLEVNLGRKADYHSDLEAIVKSRHGGSEEYHTTVNGGGPSLSLETEKGDIRLHRK